MINQVQELLQNLKRERAVHKEKMVNYFQLLKNAEPEPSADSSGHPGVVHGTALSTSPPEAASYSMSLCVESGRYAHPSIE
ncbi:hypothetical protein MLD38_006877 [Melastoma candidum]|uniref:Uncharacterized protein n=1 Tax=Melastoma candidum TaxID=119954 RepID=A0ACB9RNH9_9MYRT|nr:hypothetical protein MLD38_006877 [Melastoma candidum]